MTNRELLANAFPLHFQRICECICADNEVSDHNGFLDDPMCAYMGAL